MQKHCEHCGRTFEAARNFRKYCSDTCKQYAYIQRIKPVNNNRQKIDAVDETLIAKGIDDTLMQEKNETKFPKRIWKSEFIKDLRQELFVKGKGARIFFQRNFPQWNKETLEEVRVQNDCLQNLLREGLQLQFQPTTTWSEIQNLYDQFDALKNENCMCCLPEDYPYHELIESMIGKLAKAFLHQAPNQIIKFRFHPALRFELLKTICEIGYNYQADEEKN